MVRYKNSPSLEDSNTSTHDSKDLINNNSSHTITHKSIIEDKFDQYYASGSLDSVSTKTIDKIRKKMHELVTHDYSDMAPHVNGYYFIHMVHGTWKDNVEGVNESTAGKFTDDYANSNDLSTFKSQGSSGFNRFTKQFGQLATDIDIPQINIEYESISGKSRNLNYASKIHFAGDFSINFLENYTNDVFRYHETWFKYIDALKKGYVSPPPIVEADDKTFIDVPYFNAVWVVIFAPFTTNIRGLIKIMGVSPVNLPFKQIIGDRSKSTLTTINQNYKSNDMIYKFYEDESDQEGSAFFQDFTQDMAQAWEL